MCLRTAELRPGDDIHLDVLLGELAHDAYRGTFEYVRVRLDALLNLERSFYGAACVRMVMSRGSVRRCR
jgi:hypothetical protein